MGRLRGRGFQVGRKPRNASSGAVGNEAHHGNLNGDTGIGAGDVGLCRVALTAEVPTSRHEFQGRPVQRIERGQPLGGREERRRVVQLVIGDGEREERFTAVGVPCQAERQGAGTGLVEALPHQPYAGAEQRIGIQILRVGAKGVEHRRGLVAMTALGVQRCERRRGVDVRRKRGHVFVERADSGCERGSQGRRIGGELLQRGGQRAPPACNRLGPRGRVAREQLLVSRRQLGAACLTGLRRTDQAGQHDGVSRDRALQRIEASPDARGPLGRGMALDLPHEQMPRVAQCLPLVGRVGRVIPGAATGESVVRVRGIVVAPARVQRRRGRERLRIMRLEAGSGVQQRQRGVQFAVLRHRQRVVHQFAPQLIPIGGDVRGARGGEARGTGERRVRGRRVARQDGVTAEVVPRGRIATLVILDDRVSQSLPGLGELGRTLVRFLDGGLERLYPIVNLGVRLRQLARCLGRPEAFLGREPGNSGCAHENDGQGEGGEARDGTHGRRLEMAPAAAAVNSGRLP